MRATTTFALILLLAGPSWAKEQTAPAAKTLDWSKSGTQQKFTTSAFHNTRLLKCSDVRGLLLRATLDAPAKDVGSLPQELWKRSANEPAEQQTRAKLASWSIDVKRDQAQLIVKMKRNRRALFGAIKLPAKTTTHVGQIVKDTLQANGFRQIEVVFSGEAYRSAQQENLQTRHLAIDLGASVSRGVYHFGPEGTFALFTHSAALLDGVRTKSVWGKLLRRLLPKDGYANRVQLESSTYVGQAGERAPQATINYRE
ncbi:MAG: hypothetical protein H6707_16570 [Deltaproteobacteria bacterium]|nr:hypothetical protein [Deltaproteobacteria bacterium]